MNFIDILFLGLALSLDSFAIALSLSLSAVCANRFLKFRYITTIALFHTIMPIIGWTIGITLDSLSSSYGDWITFVLFLSLGLKMIWDAVRSREDDNSAACTLSLMPMLLMALAVSVDALLSGVSFRFAGIMLLSTSELSSVVISSVIIGLEALFITWLGFAIGDRLSSHLSRWAPFTGGVLLILLGLKILLNI